MSCLLGDLALDLVQIQTYISLSLSLSLHALIVLLGSNDAVQHVST